jgi:hypothetical protein
LKATLTAQDPALWRDVYGIELPAREVFTFGAILGGVVDVVDCVWIDDLAASQRSVWALPGCYGWILANPRSFQRPIPYRGGQQFFNVPDEVLPPNLRAA